MGRYLEQWAPPLYFSHLVTMNLFHNLIHMLLSLLETSVSVNASLVITTFKIKIFCN